jgi:hypothetical protein
MMPISNREEHAMTRSILEFLTLAALLNACAWVAQFALPSIF